ncbi:uncharacterized protein CXorf49 homolog [Perognathus longimembris pacificus]|uniref:uncharacterized protein CXorf49 homolog n=1 Tax=Perognathus longimembris pacificus TaxID=214514 RepID=UPI002018817B|nr:uncharacterized protein CXorf49 homolog [Perognathus longimembris pacificus]
MFSQKDQRSSSDTDSECSRRPRTRRSRRQNCRSQVYSDSPKESESKTGSSDDEDEDIFYSMPGNLLPSSPQEPKTIKEKQRVLEETSCKIKQSVTRECPEAVSAAGDMPRGNLTKNIAMEKKLPEGPLRVTLGRNTPSWRQIMKTPPLEAAALPPILGIPPCGGSKATSTLHPGPKQYKQGNTLKRFGAWKRRKSYPVAREVDEGNRDPGQQVQIQGDIMLKGHVNSDDREQPMYYHDKETPLQASGEQGCSQCLMVHGDIEKLKEQLAAIQSLTEKFQSLGI